MNDLFLNLLRTSLVIGTVFILLALLTPLWNRRYGGPFGKNGCGACWPLWRCWGSWSICRRVPL
jgi:hypothetical protein